MNRIDCDSEIGFYIERYIFIYTIGIINLLIINPYSFISMQKHISVRKE